MISQQTKYLSDTGKSIIKALAYYDLFNYPLNEKEIYFNLGNDSVSMEQVSTEINHLCNSRIIYNKNDFFMLSDNVDLVNKRLEGNKLAEKRLAAAYTVSKYISKFPYVRAVLLSGSISKGYMTKDSDVDYFIITKPNRLWVARLFLMVFKKIFLLNSRKLFCINYFIDSDTLEIEEKNIFTATELVTLIPTYSSDLYHKLFQHNSWVKNYFPHFIKRDTSKVYDRKNSIVKSVFEMMLNNSLGDKLDDFAMKLFDRSNRIKYRKYDSNDFKVAFKTSKKESKHHPRFFQKRVLEAFNLKLKTVEETYNISLR